MRDYISSLKESNFYTYTITDAFAPASVHAYIFGSPFVFIKLFGISENQYGLVFGFKAFGLIMASQISCAWPRSSNSSNIIFITDSFPF